MRFLFSFASLPALLLVLPLGSPFFVFLVRKQTTIALTNPQKSLQICTTAVSEVEKFSSVVVFCLLDLQR